MRKPRLRTTPARLTGSKWASPAMTAAAVRHLGDREGKQDRRAKSAGEGRGGAAPLHVAPVVQAPVAFNNGKVGIAE